MERVMKRYTIIDTWCPYTRDDYKQYCSDMDIEYDENDTCAYLDWMNQEIEWETEDFMRGLTNSKYANEECLVFGTLGLWDGRHKTCGHFDHMKDAVLKCINNMDGWIIEQDDKAIYVTTIHHDGQNQFTIRLLNELGRQRFDEDDFEENDDNFQILDYLF